MFGMGTGVSLSPSSPDHLLLKTRYIVYHYPLVVNYLILIYWLIVFNYDFVAQFDFIGLLHEYAVSFTKFFVR